MPQKEKQVWIIIETAIEKMITLLKEEKFIIQTSKKIGRPKKTQDIKINQEQIFMQNFLNQKNNQTEKVQDIDMKDETNQN